MDLLAGMLFWQSTDRFKFLWSGLGSRNAESAEWYDYEVRPLIEADEELSDLAHMKLRAELIKRRRFLQELSVYSFYN